MPVHVDRKTSLQMRPGPVRSGGKGWRSFALAVVCSLALTAVGAQRQDATEYRFKAVYILNFLRFVQWPDSLFQAKDSPLVLGVLGPDPFGSILDQTMSNEKIDGHPIVIKRIGSTNMLDSCQALFVSTSLAGDVEEISRKSIPLHILTIGDKDTFADRGLVISFLVQDNRLLFEINLRALKQSGIEMSSKLLRLAKTINPS